LTSDNLMKYNILTE